jgi:hypothetical protein
VLWPSALRAACLLPPATARDVCSVACCIGGAPFVVATTHLRPSVSSAALSARYHDLSQAVRELDQEPPATSVLLGGE